MRREQASVWQLDFGNCQLDRNDAAVPAPGIHQHAPAEHVGHPRRMIARHARLMGGPKMIRHDQFANRPPGRVLCGIAEDGLGGGIDADHGSTLIDDDDRIEGGADDGRVEAGMGFNGVQSRRRVALDLTTRVAHAFGRGGTNM